MSTTIIGLLGQAGSGKTTVADYLVGCYGAKKYAFADPLKELVMRTFDFSRGQVYGTQTEKETVDARWGLSPRQALQRVGQGMRDVFGPNVWIDHLLRRIQDDGPDVAVVEDVRFVNEAANIRAWGGRSEVWRIQNPNRESIADGKHPSEAEWASAPYDQILCPAAKDLDGLYWLVRMAARNCNLTKVI